MILDIAKLAERISNNHRQPIPAPTARPDAAVFALLVQRTATKLLLIRRAQGDEPFAGHIALPGGRIDPSDADPLAAAHREAHEEVGIQSCSISNVCSLGQFKTNTGAVTLNAYVGQWDGKTQIKIQPTEVADAFELSIDSLWTHYQQQGFNNESATGLGSNLTFPTPQGQIWGVTARILHALLSTVSPGCD